MSSPTIVRSLPPLTLAPAQETHAAEGLTALHLRGVEHLSGAAILLLAPDSTPISWSRSADAFVMAERPEDIPLTKPENAAVVAALVQRAIGATGTVRTKLTMRRLNGAAVEIDAHALSLINANGQPVGVSLILSGDPATNVEAAEMARRWEDRKARFMASASHDLRQPLQAILWLVSRLEHDGAADADILERLRKKVGIMRTQLDQYHSLSQMAEGQIVPQRETFAFNDLAVALVEQMQPLARAKKLRLVMEPTDAHVVSDRKLLTAMLVQLLDNAIKYTDSGRVVLGAEIEGDHLVVSVEDTGIGIAAADFDAVWEELYQIGNSERDRSRGFGLGLPYVRRLSLALDHPVRLDSALGRGTRFFIDIPLTPVETAPSEDGGSNVLVLVDDDAGVRETMAMVVEMLGYEVIASGTIAGAIESLPAGCIPRAMILDYRLIEETGVEGAARIRAHVGRFVPGILLTGDPDVADEAAKADLSLLLKPAAMEVLSRALDAAISNAAAR